MNEYLVIARKYRPQQFGEILGQEQATTTLINAIKSSRVAHAYLFCGTKGIGKTTIARILAKALNCEQGPTPTPCDKCAPCIEIRQGLSLDVLEIDGASNRGIDEIRELRENVKFAAAGSRFKIYIIDEVHMLTPEAFNALLKTLEEPPGHVKFFFATTAPDKVPATILSRCQRFELKRIPVELTVKRIQDIAKREKIKISPDTMYTIARCAGGSMRDAESTLDKLIAYSGNSISEEDTLAILGIVSQEVLHKIAEAAATADMEQALGITAEIFEKGKDLNQFILDLAGHFRNILLAKYSPETHKLIELPEDDLKKVIKISERFSQAQLLEIINILTEMQGEIKWSLSKRISLETGIIRIARAKHKISLEQLIDRLEELKNGLGAMKTINHPEQKPQTENKTIPAEPPQPLSPPLPAADTPPFARIEQCWQEILANLGKRNPLLKSYMAEGVPLEYKNNILTVGFDPNYSLHQEALSKPKNIELIEQRFQERIGVPLKLQFRTIAAEPKKNQNTVKTIDNPLIEKVRQKFNAKIISIKTE